MHRVRHNDRIEHGLQRLGDERLKRVTLYWKTQFGHIREGAGMSGHHHGDFPGADISPGGLNAADRTILPSDTGDFAVLNDVDTAGIGCTGKPPGHGIMARNTTARLKRCTKHRIPGLARHVHRRHFYLDLSGGEDLAVNAV